MICLRCGYCCIHSAVVVVKDPHLGPIEGNLIFIGDEDGHGRCPHLRGNEPGEYSCAVHNYPWYKGTPCYKHTQIESSNSNCRMGVYILKKTNGKIPNS